MSLTDWFSSPEPINPDKIADYMQSDSIDTLKTRATDMIDPNSPLMLAQKNNMFQNAQDSLYTSNRIAMQNNLRSGHGNQSGIANFNMDNTAHQTLGNISKGYQDWVANNLNASNNLLTTTGQHEAKIGEAQASAYGQNITNQNNYNSAMAGNVMNVASMVAMCDKRMKENIKKVGNVKIKGNHTVPLYQFTYKGRKKKHTNVMAQDVEKVNPKAVFTGKNGLKYVSMKDLF